MSIDTGAFLRGLTKGLFAAQEMRTQREATEERKARLSEERARQKADYLFQIRGLTEATADPETHERLLTTAEEAGQAFGFKPGELRTVIGGFPESKKNRRRQALAKERVTDLQRIYEGRFWTPEIQGLTVPFEGRTIPVRDLVSIADILATREVKRPIREEVQVSRAEEGGLARFLAPRTEERVVGEEIVREPALPIPAQPLTFEQLYEKARGTPWQGRSVPTTKEGLPDLKAATQIAKDNGWIVTNEDQFRVRERYQKFLREKLVAGMRGPGVDLGVLRKQMEQAGMNWAAERDKARQEIALAAATLAQKLRGGGDGGGVSTTVSVFGNWKVLPPLTKSGESRYRNRRTNQVLSRSGATDVLKRTRDSDLAAALGVTVPTAEEPTEKVEGREMTLEQIEDEMRIAGQEVGELVGTKEKDAASRRLKLLTAARTRLLRRTGRKPPPRGSQVTPIPPAIPGQQAVPEGAPTATNPQTGQRAYWDGERWVPIP